MHFQFQDPAPADGAAIAAAIREQLRSQVHEAASTSMPLGGDPPVSLTDQAAIGAGCLVRSLESFERLKLAAAEVSACAKRIGTPPPKPPTLRGGFGAFAIRLISRALWWYTQPMQDFAAALGRRQEQDVETCACLVLAQDVISGSLNDVRQQVQQLQAALAVAQTRFGLRCSELESAQIQAQSAQIDARLGAEEQARTAEVSRIEQTMRQTDARLVSISGSMEELAQSLQTETQTREALAQETQVHIVRVEQKVDAGLDTALIRSATLDARLSGETQAREQLAQQLSDEFSRKDHTQERVADMGRLVHQTRAEVNLQGQRVSMLIAEARKRLPDPLNKKQLENIVAQEDHKLDALYVAFENVFRGPREEVKAKQSIYIPLLKEHHIGSKNMPVLDVGCGRGEWLELMRDNGLLAQGLDRNEIMIAQCRELGLDVVQGDAMSHLRTLPDKSLGAVTAFHIVEHLPFETVLAFIDETVRVLKPGGMVIFETPNPQNVLVGSMTFYYDPTHLHPLPSGMLRFFVEARGLCDVYIKDVNPYPEWVRLPDTDKGLARRLNEYFYGPQDYAIIGRKA